MQIHSVAPNHTSELDRLRDEIAAVSAHLICLQQRRSSKGDETADGLR
jgi:hypothetical protein